MTRAPLSDNLRGSGLMVLAMLGFAIEDMLLKSAAAAGLSVGLILMLFGAGGSLGFAALTLRRGEALWHPAMASRAVIARAASEMGGRLFYTLALAFGALSTTSAILQAAPLVVVAGAALILNEKVGWRRWSAILIGFAGVLIILRPDVDGIGWASVFALLGMLGFSGRDLATRAAPKILSNMQLGLCGFIVLVPTGFVLALFDGGLRWPSGTGLAYVGLGTVVGIAAYTALTGAMRTGEVGVVTPFRYTRLLFGVAFGMLVFGERPDALTYLGSAIVLAAGLYTMLRERSTKRATH